MRSSTRHGFSPRSSGAGTRLLPVIRPARSAISSPDTAQATNSNGSPKAHNLITDAHAPLRGARYLGHGGGSRPGADHGPDRTRRDERNRGDGKPDAVGRPHYLGLGDSAGPRQIQSVRQGERLRHPRPRACAVAVMGDRLCPNASLAGSGPHDAARRDDLPARQRSHQDGARAPRPQRPLVSPAQDQTPTTRSCRGSSGARAQGIGRVPGDGRARLRLGEVDERDVLPRVLGGARDADRHRALPQRLWAPWHLGRRAGEGTGGDLPEGDRGDRPADGQDSDLGRRHPDAQFHVHRRLRAGDRPETRIASGWWPRRPTWVPANSSR